MLKDPVRKWWVMAGLAPIWVLKALGGHSSITEPRRLRTVMNCGFSPKRKRTKVPCEKDEQARALM